MSGETRVAALFNLQRELQDDADLGAALNRAFDAVGFTDEAARERRASGKRKAIKDNVWGMLDFGAHEMRLIDSPLIQRMRGIHQLGFSYLTYGNGGGVTVTNMNVPSSTVTALWMPGTYKGRPWIPLFLRRGRYKDLILA